MILAFDCVDGAEPAQPWDPADLDRVVAAVGQLSQALTSSPIDLPRDHPRLGGWAALAADQARCRLLPAHFSWAAERLAQLIKLEEEGLMAAQGSSLVHFDLYPHNILLTPEHVLFVDWPHARLGAPYIDLLTLLSSAAGDGLDSEPILGAHSLTADIEPYTIDAVLAAHAGFCVDGALYPASPGLEPIIDAKLSLSRGPIEWLQRRLSRHR